MLRAIAEDRTVGLAMDSVLVRRDGFESAIEDSAAPIHNREGQVSGAVVVFHDVSASRAMALEMAHLAQHDFLTSLPNRMLLTERFSTRSDWPDGTISRSGCCSSTSIISSTSMTRWGMRSATVCCSRLRTDWWTVCAPPTRCAARVVMNS